MKQFRVLVIDDNPNIVDDFRKVLAPAPKDNILNEMAGELFGETSAMPVERSKTFVIDSADQGKAGLALVKRSLAEGRPYALAFIDMRMPPGWDGLETIRAIWEIESEIQIVICTAHSDHSWHDIDSSLGETDRLLVVKKPFDTVEIVQCAHALCSKWWLHRLDVQRLSELEDRVAERTQHLVLAQKRLKQEVLDRQRMEVELRHAQKLESVGQLAAGIAHELNTPIQYVGDSVRFLGDSFTHTMELVTFYRNLIKKWQLGEAYQGYDVSLQAAEEDADIKYVRENTPAAIARCEEGINRVARIVRAMKEFAHPGVTEMQPANLNQAIETTIEVARSEYKLVADVHLNLGEIPDVSCSVGDINQVLLNLVVNAAHAIGDAEKEKGRGTITLSSEVEGEDVVIRIVDTGTGIPEEIRHKVFDPFFTTKEVGKGTGQGLALAYAMIVEKHFGRIELDSTQGEGTTFVLRVPIHSRRNPPAIDAELPSPRGTSMKADG